MKQRAVRIGLIALVLVVWGAVVARALRRPQEHGAITPPENTDPIAAQRSDTAARSPFTLARDPFLDDGQRIHLQTVNTGSNPTTSHTFNRPSRPGTTAEPLTAKKASVVEYLGFLKRTGPSGKACAILRINGRTEVVAIGGTAADIRVKAATSTEVVIEREGVEERVGR